LTGCQVSLQKVFTYRKMLGTVCKKKKNVESFVPWFYIYRRYDTTNYISVID
jgi:hypothetical protein